MTGPGHQLSECGDCLSSIKTLRFAPTARRLAVLTERSSGAKTPLLMAGVPWATKESSVIDRGPESSIVVTIGDRTRLYRGFVTSAASRLDAPGTITLYEGALSDVGLFASDEAVLQAERARTTARLILIDSAEFAWQRSRCREEQQLLVSADGVLVDANTLQRWLWRRLREFTVEAMV